MLTKLEFSGQIFEKSSNTKFHKISFSGSEFSLEGGRMDGHSHRQIQMTKLIAAFRNFANAPKILNFVHINSPVFHMILTTI
jgi:hypothetical protein